MLVRQGDAANELGAVEEVAGVLHADGLQVHGDVTLALLDELIFEVKLLSL